jgi:CubicO group peptidase (beta-lactamase class C family)
MTTPRHPARTVETSAPHQPPTSLRGFRTLTGALGTAFAGVVLAIAPFLPASATSHPLPDGPGSATTVTATGTATGTAPSSTTDPPSGIASALDRYMRTQIAQSTVPGAAVALVRGDRVLLVRGYGHDATGQRVTGTSLFRVASLSKAFTALAVMQLVDAGKLDLDDPVQEHLPEFQLDDPRAGQVTVRELLNHTSGLTDAVVPDVSRTQPRTPREATTSLRTAHLATAPGTSFSYHNPNYQVAARLVEVLSGEPFNDYLRRHVLTPAGMGDSTATATDDQVVPGLPRGHVTAYGHAFTAPAFGTFTTGDGGVVSDAADMARWLIVNTSGGRGAGGTQLVSAAGMRTLHTPSTPGSPYVLGWGVHGSVDSATDRAGGPARLEHSGSLLTYTSEAAIWPRSGYGVVVLFNAGSPMLLDQTAIVHGVFDIVEGTTPPAHAPTLATRLDTALAVLTLIALVAGMRGVVRSRRWVRRRHTWVRRAFGLVPAVVVIALTLGFPAMTEAWMGRDITWREAAYGWPALVVFVLTAALVAAATLISRTWHWARRSARRSARPCDSGRRRSGIPTAPAEHPEDALPVA